MSNAPCSTEVRCTTAPGAAQPTRQRGHEAPPRPARSRAVASAHARAADPADLVEITTGHHGLYAAHLTLDAHVRTGALDKDPALHKAVVLASDCFYTASMRAAQCTPWATVILDRAPFADIFIIIETAHKVAPRRYLDRFLPDAHTALTDHPADPTHA